jgi:hypothetical protein
MGHASPDITLGVYTHYCEESRKEETFTKARTARSGLRTTNCRTTCTTAVPQAAVN